jgi:hypothetical protein
MEPRTSNNLHFGLPPTGAILKNSLDNLAAMQFGRQWLQFASDMLTLTNIELETFTPLHREPTGNVATCRHSVGFRLTELGVEYHQCCRLHDSGQIVKKRFLASLGSKLDDPLSSPPMIYKLWVDGAKEQASSQRLISEYKSYVVDEKRHCVACKLISLCIHRRQRDMACSGVSRHQSRKVST